MYACHLMGVIYNNGMLELDMKVFKWGYQMTMEKKDIESYYYNVSCFVKYMLQI